MDLKEIRQIVELMNEHQLSLFHLEKKEFNIKLKKAPDLEALRELYGGLVMPGLPTALAPAPVGGTAPEEPLDDGVAVSSPMVGTFFRGPAPEAEPFVSVGDIVREGQILCIIEAMKVMNEIRAESSGIITEVCVDDATPVQYGDLLFRMK